MTAQENTSPYEIRREDAPARLLFLCDHASNRVPPEYGLLGLGTAEFATHIASDIGAAEVARRLADRFAAPAILARWSRLLIDLNRGPDDPTLVMRLSDGRIIPGNRMLTDADIAERIRRYHAPYHAAIAAKIAQARAEGLVPILISLHSFTPVWRGAKRPWHIGVLWDRDARLARALMARLAAEPDLVVGDNEPYSGALENDCLYRHGTMNGLPHVLIEIRQDLIADAAGAAFWAARLGTALADVFKTMGEPHMMFSRALSPPEGVAPPEGGKPMDENTRTELEAAAFRRLVAHLRARTDVQNIDLMNLAGFCRNCLGDWYREAAADKGIVLEKDQAREIVYGMAPAEWKKRFQKEASAESRAQFTAASKPHG